MRTLLVISAALLFALSVSAQPVVQFQPYFDGSPEREALLVVVRDCDLMVKNEIDTAKLTHLELMNAGRKVTEREYYAAHLIACVDAELSRLTPPLKKTTA